MRYDAHMQIALRHGRVVLAAAAAAFLLSACAKDSNDQDQKRDVDRRAESYEAYLPKNTVELDNYNEAQRLYDSPSTIIWCSTTWGNASAPIVTVPIKGKLTSSSTTFFRPEEVVNKGSDGSGVVVSSRSVDGLFHPSPPRYRYGFTPGGQYVDFFNMATFCTTALTKFQRQETRVAVDYDEVARLADKRAERALSRGDGAAAERILSDAVGGGGR
jgi:hypothetical protein